MSRLFFLNLFSKLSLLSFLAVVAVSCGKSSNPEAPLVDMDADDVDQTEEEEATTASGEEASKDTTAKEDSLDSAQAVCFSEGELIESVGITTDLFYAGSSFEDNYGNMFKFYDSQYSVVLNDDFAATEFSVDSGDIKTLISSGELAEAQVSDVSYVKFMFNTDLTFTSTQKDFFTDLSSEEQSDFIEYEFKQLFDSLAGTFELSLNDKAFFSSDDKSKFSYELSGFHSIETMVDTEVETEAAQESDDAAEVVTEDADADSDADVESQGSGLSGDDDSAVATEDEGSDDGEMAATEDSTDAEEMVEGDDTEEELVAEDNTIAFKVTATVTYLVSAEDLMANSTFASLTTCAAAEAETTDAGSGESDEEAEGGETEASESEDTEEVVEVEGAESTEDTDSTDTDEVEGSTEDTDADDEVVSSQEISVIDGEQRQRRCRHTEKCTEVINL